MLPKKERLTKEDFMGPKVFFRCDLLDISYIPSPVQKFACVISKKTLKKAVERNSVKRRVLAAITEHKPHKVASFIIYPKKTALDAPYSSINEEIRKAFDTLQ
jgi:ribonuclease P protein component